MRTDLNLFKGVLMRFLQVIFCLFIFVSLTIPASATKLVSYTFRGETRLGAWHDGQIVDLNRAYQLFIESQGKPRSEEKAEAFVPSDIIEFLQGEDESISEAKRALAYVKSVLREPSGLLGLQEAGVLFSESEVQLQAAVPNPPHLLAIGLNYKAHAEEGGSKLPEYPIVFSKEGSMIGPGDTIVIPREVQKPDYEVELAFVIGRHARNVELEKALEYVAGYSAFNDVSARGIQGRVSQWTMGKSPDTFSAMGPFLVLQDEVPDPQDLRIRTRLNGKTVQDSNTKDMIFGVAELVTYISQFMTLTPGTVVVTGTPSGVGSARGRFLQVGDVIEVEIEKLGILTNRVERE